MVLMLGGERAEVVMPPGVEPPVEPVVVVGPPAGPEVERVWMVQTDPGTVVPVAADWFLPMGMAAPLVFMSSSGPAAVFAAGEWRWAVEAGALAVGEASEARGG